MNESQLDTGLFGPPPVDLCGTGGFAFKTRPLHPASTRSGRHSLKPRAETKEGGRVACVSVSLTSALSPFSVVFMCVKIDLSCTCAGGASLPEACWWREACPRRGGIAGLPACSADWMSDTHHCVMWSDHATTALHFSLSGSQIK